MRKFHGMFIGGIALVAVVCSGCGPSILEGEDASLVGTWRLNDAKQAEEGDFTISEDRIVVNADVLEISGDYGVDTTKNPHEIDLLLDELTGGLEAYVGNAIVQLLVFDNLRVLEGIYEVDETSLRIFLAPRIFGRPSAFPDDDSSLGTGQFLIEATRVE